MIKKEVFLDALMAMVERMSPSLPAKTLKRFYVNSKVTSKKIIKML
jgi:hypothetical protein